MVMVMIITVIIQKIKQQKKRLVKSIRKCLNQVNLTISNRQLWQNVKSESKQKKNQKFFKKWQQRYHYVVNVCMYDVQFDDEIFGICRMCMHKWWWKKKTEWNHMHAQINQNAHTHTNTQIQALANKKIEIVSKFFVDSPTTSTKNKL